MFVFFPAAAGLWLVGLAGVKGRRWIAMAGLAAMPLVLLHHLERPERCQPGRMPMVAIYGPMAAMLLLHARPDP